jgi:membrane protease YdiL (CAAX protease family)
MPWDFWLIFLVLAVVLPWRGLIRLRRILELPKVDTRERLTLYASTIAFQWLAVAITGWRVWVHGFTAAQLGLVVPDRARIAISSVAGILILAGLQWMNLRRIGRHPLQMRGVLQSLAERILPRTGVELLPYFALAVTAGVCEEFLYRGFAMAAMNQVSLATWSVVLFSSALFGLAHLYQGRAGIVSTLVLGTVFGLARIAYDSLVPVILWHIAVDVVAGIAGPRYLLRTSASDSEL